MSNLFVVYTYGGGEVIENIFNAIAVIYKDGYMEEFFQLSIMLGLAVAGIKAGVTRDHTKYYGKWLAGYLLVIMVLMQPISIFGHKGMTIYFRDVVTGRAGKVDHLPPGLVVPAGIISGMGYSITKLFETLFSSPMPEYLPYYKYGTVFAAQVRSDLKEVKIQDPIFRENLESYITKCMFYDVMIGANYDIRELQNSADIWGLLKEKSSNLRMFNYRNENNGGRELVNCKAGLGKLETFFNKEANLIAKKFPQFTQLMNARPANNQNVKNGFVKALELSGNFYGNINGSASEQLRQILFINQWKTTPHSYGTMKAMQSQNTTWKMLGDLGQLSLPILHAIFQALIYASFPIVITILFFSQRYQTLRTYFEMMVWIELWPLLFAILNGAVSIFARRAGIDEVITIGTMDNIVNTQSQYAMMAYGMGMSIPAFAYMIAKGGVSQFVHMAGSLTSATQAGASIAAAELTTGNRTLDNVSVGNRSFNNVSGNKHDTSGFFQTGFMKTRHSDGAIETQNLYSDQHGGKIYQTGAGFTRSTGSVAFSSVQSNTEQDEIRLSDLQGKIAGERRAVTESASELKAKASSFMARDYENILETEGYNLGHDGREGSTLSKVAGVTKTLVEDYGYTKEQAGSMAVGAGLKLDIGGGSKGLSVASLLKASLGMAASIDGGMKLNDTDRQSITESSKVDVDNRNTELFDDIMSYSKKNSVSEAQGSEVSDSKSFNQSYDEYKQKQNTLEYHENESKQLESSLRTTKSYQFTKTEEGWQEFLSFFADHQNWKGKPGTKFGYRDALYHIENRTPEYQEVAKQWEQKKEGRENLPSGRITPEKLRLYHEDYDRDNEYTDRVKTQIDNSKVEDKTQDVEVPAEFAKKPTLSSSGEDVKSNVNNLLTDNAAIIQNQSKQTNQEKQKLENKVDEADQTIFAGKIIRGLGIAGTENQFVQARKNKGDNEKNE